MFSLETSRQFYQVKEGFLAQSCIFCNALFCMKIIIRLLTYETDIGWQHLYVLKGVFVSEFFKKTSVFIEKRNRGNMIERV